MLAMKLATAPDTLSQPELQQIVWMVDLMAACLPDNQGREWEARYRDLGAHLREIYWSYYKSSAYQGCIVRDKVT